MRCINCKINLLFFIALFAGALSAVAQTVIRGKVVNEATAQPLQGASIYFNNTSIGTSSNAEGVFSIPLPAMENAELIISSVGYERLVYKPDASTIQHNTIVFKLAQKAEQLKDVLILTDAVRKKYLAIFEKEFLGITEEASRSSIQNKKDIYFTNGGSKNSFKAYSDTPLVITNRMMGYKISFELVEFFYDEQSGRTSYYGYTRFDEMGVKNKWKKNRQHCYYGSTIHFYRALISNRLKEENYHIYLIKPVRMTNDTSKKSSREEMDMAYEVTAAQIISADTSNTSNYNVVIPGKLMVQYGKNPSSKSYLSKNTFLQGGLPVGFRAYVTVTSPAISLNNAGIINNPMDVLYAGYWIYEKAANMLPYNYVPE
ncbi:carboxypeptidase-like regulatory domain-containing protein [Ferruginibacter paludis]|uniref:carboxypeptidase-like regulatory domain-containing protein n=1 Tax=Ferruginibacter paludis TaxID=1310417 RepID=UPI0025B3C975|nr:carboxypeptidase-like regulatory domain-containing protein [Ferruginibacter paludis]MDN3658059.1 carboxypeptidase-like regulatory domain-containing protein [Ferruginibacter paludis]